jgi:hypothetical protein
VEELRKITKIFSVDGEAPGLKIENQTSPTSKTESLFAEPRRLAILKKNRSCLFAVYLTMLSTANIV